MLKFSCLTYKVDACLLRLHEDTRLNTHSCWKLHYPRKLLVLSCVDARTLRHAGTGGIKPIRSEHAIGYLARTLRTCGGVNYRNLNFYGQTLGKR